MRKKDLSQIAASAVVAVAGAAVGVAMMVISGKKLDERKEQEKKLDEHREQEKKLDEQIEQEKKHDEHKEQEKKGNDK